MAFFSLFAKKNSKRVWNDQGRWLDIFYSTSRKWVFFTYQSLSHHKLMELFILSDFLQKADRPKNYVHIYRNANKFCLQLPSAVILEPKKIKYVTVSIVSPSVCQVMELNAMIFVFRLWTPKLWLERSGWPEMRQIIGKPRYWTSTHF